MLFRIPGKFNEPETDEWDTIEPSQKPQLGPPVLFQHGLLDSADSWIVNDVDKAPALIAAEAGYDVWLGNLRGNKYSKTHDYLDSVRNKKEFFDFDIESHTTIDLVSFIEYISIETFQEHEKIAYVGHSMGTTVMFRLAA